MLRRLWLALFFLTFASAAWAQGCGSTNPNCIVPTRPAGDSTNAAANTAWVNTNAVVTSALGAGVAAALAQPVTGAGGVQTLVAPTINVGSVCGYPTANQPCVGGTTSAGFLMAGNIAIGNNISGVDTFVAVWDNNIFTNPNQEMRGVTVALGETRSNADASIGWDIIPFSASSVIEATNTQAIIGNLKGYFGETILGAGAYTVTHAYPFQASLTSIGAGVTLSYWAGMVVSQGPAGCATQCSVVYGLDIGYQYGVSSAAVYIRGEGPGQAIKFPTTSIYEDVSGKLNINPASNYLVIVNPLTATTASAGTYTPPTTVQGYLQVILGGNAYKIAYYQP